MDLRALVSQNWFAKGLRVLSEFLKESCEWFCECSQVKIYEALWTLRKFSLGSAEVASGDLWVLASHPLKLLYLWVKNLWRVPKPSQIVTCEHSQNCSQLYKTTCNFLKRNSYDHLQTLGKSKNSCSTRKSTSKLFKKLAPGRHQCCCPLGGDVLTPIATSPPPTRFSFRYSWNRHRSSFVFIFVKVPTITRSALLGWTQRRS